MARSGHRIEKLLEIVGENSDSGIQFLFGSGAPGGDAGEQDDAPLGSVYLRTDSYKFYKKDIDTNAASDWIDLGSFFDLIGVSEDDLDLGTFTGNIISDSNDVKGALQELETYIENNVVEDKSGSGVTTETVIDDELVDDILAVEYLVVISLNSAPAQRRALLITISHNGTVSADATATDDSVFSKLKHGAAFNYTLSSGVSGTGAAQKMELKLASTEGGGVDYNIRKIGQVVA